MHEAKPLKLKQYFAKYINKRKHSLKIYIKTVHKTFLYTSYPKTCRQARFPLSKYVVFPSRDRSFTLAYYNTVLLSMNID